MPAILSRVLLPIALTLWMLVLWAVPVAANATSPKKNAFNRVKLLERQILLTEQIGASVCFLMADIEAASQSDKARGAATLFSTVQAALRTGDENMAILPETSSDMTRKLDQIDEIFATYQAATLQLVNNDMHTVPASQVMRLDDILALLVHEAVEIVNTEYGAVSASETKRATLARAREQTRLVQRLSKSMCYIMLDINTDEMRAELRHTLAQFATNQSDLRSGKGANGSRAKPKTAVIKKIDAVDALWAEIAALATSAADDALVPVEALIKVAELSNKLLFKTKQVSRAFGK